MDAVRSAIVAALVTSILVVLLARDRYLRRKGMSSRFHDATSSVRLALFVQGRALVGLGLTLAFTVLGAAVAGTLLGILLPAMTGDWSNEDGISRAVTLVPLSFCLAGALTGFLMARFAGARWLGLCIPSALWVLGLAWRLGQWALLSPFVLIGTFLGAWLGYRRARRDAA